MHLLKGSFAYGLQPMAVESVYSVLIGKHVNVRRACSDLPVPSNNENDLRKQVWRCTRVTGLNKAEEAKRT